VNHHSYVYPGTAGKVRRGENWEDTALEGCQIFRTELRYVAQP